MKFYAFLRKWFCPGDAAILTGAWYAVLLYLIFLGLAQQGMDLRYAHL